MDPVFRALCFTAALLCWLVKAVIEAPPGGRKVDYWVLGWFFVAVPFVWDAWETV